MLQKRKWIISLCLSIVYSTFIIIGNSFMHSNSFNWIEKNLLINILLYILLVIVNHLAIYKLFTFLDKKRICKMKIIKLRNTKLFRGFKSNPFLFSLIFIIICWLPYIISFYPAILSPDPSFQIRQYFSIPNKYSDYSVMIDPNVTITNHHPVIHTLLLGTCVKIGTMINNVNVGLFLYSIIQISTLSATLAYTIKFLREQNIDYNYLFLMLLVYSFVPVFPFYSMAPMKDVIFGSLVIHYIIQLYKIVKNEDMEVKEGIKVIALLILIILFRNNGIHTIALSFPLLLFMKKKKIYRLKLLTILVLILGFNYSYNSVILPYFRVTPTSVREKLSIPFQQTARYVKNYSDEISEGEKQVIDKILEYDTLASRYKEEISDPVKHKYNKYATKDDLKQYFNIWMYELKKHPKVYMEATINNTYGYYYPLKTNWYFYCNFDKRITDNGFNYHFNNFEKSRNILTEFGEMFQYIPLLNIFVNIGFNVWLLLFMFSYLLYKKKYKELIYLSPSFVLFLVCIASPVNTYFRYALPYVFALMLNFGLFTKEGVLDER